MRSANTSFLGCRFSFAAVQGGVDLDALSKSSSQDSLGPNTPRGSPNLGKADRQGKFCYVLELWANQKLVCRIESSLH